MPRRNQLIVLGAAVVVLAAVVYYQWSLATDSGLPGAASARSLPAGAAARGQGQHMAPVPEVRIDALTAARAQPPPPPAGRNLFQFQPKLPPPPPPTAMRPATVAENAVPPPPPPPPPIPYKFIGIVQAPDKKLAVLADASTHDVFYGREGEVIDGRYRILRIGVESIEMAYLDGRGRQTIRLTGS
jgi:hypothetical protein